MVDSIASTTSILGRPLYYQGCGLYGNNNKDGLSYLSKRSGLSFCRIPNKDESVRKFLGGGLSCICVASVSSPVAPIPWRRNETSGRRGGEGRWEVSSIKALAMEMTKEVFAFKEEERVPRKLGVSYPVDRMGLSSTAMGLYPPSNKADKPSLHNPLLRQERLGCGWLGVIFEWEGVIIEDNPELENQAWLTLSREEGRSPPPAFILKRAEGMKNEHAISEVLCWSRDPIQTRRLASRKEEIYRGLQGGIYRLRSGSREFVNVLMNYNIPMAVVSTRPRNTLESAIRSTEVEGFFNVIVAMEDVHRGKPDPEMFVYAAQLLDFIPERCIVFGNSNSTVEAAHDAHMKCVAVASKHPMYELGAADLVVKHLDELTIVDLKKLAAIESTEFEPEVEMEEEEDDPIRSTAIGVDDNFW